MNNIFLSFSSVQSEEARKVCRFLEERGMRCFIATRDLIPGEEYAAQLVNRIENSDAVVLLLSTASNESPHVLREIEFAVSHHIPIIVYPLEKVVLTKSMEYFLMTHQWITDTENRDERLVESLQHLLSAKAADSKPADASTPRAYPGEVPKEQGKSKAPVKILLAAVIALLILLCPVILYYQPHRSEVDEKEIPAKTCSLEPGEVITLGSLYDTPIPWRVLKVNEDGTVILISKDILTMQAFDAAEGGCYNEYDGIDYWARENNPVEDEALLVQIRGNNDWSVSNIRTWLNSDKEVVSYRDQAPTKAAVGANFYSSAPGFLYGFTETEKAALVPVQNTTPANALSSDAENGMLLTEDTVFLLSAAELQWFEDAGIPRYAKPNETCLLHDRERSLYDNFVEYSDTENYYWWLRSGENLPVNQSALVTPDTDSESATIPASVGISNYGIRPAICIDPSKLEQNSQD